MARTRGRTTGAKTYKQLSSRQGPNGNTPEAKAEELHSIVQGSKDKTLEGRDLRSLFQRARILKKKKLKEWT